MLQGFCFTRSSSFIYSSYQEVPPGQCLWNVASEQVSPQPGGGER